MEKKVYDDTNKGRLFYNEKKTDKYPDLTGVINVNGIEYQLSAWKYISAKGNEYLSLKVSEVFKQKETKETKSENICDLEKVKISDDMPDFLKDL